MNDLLRQRCAIHSSREAVAVCPVCRRYFCRECITEHEDRVLCARCLRKAAPVNKFKSTAYGGLIRLGQLAAGMIVMWVFFYYLGQALISLPSAFHEGNIWQIEWWRD